MKKIISNICWLFFDKVLRLAVGLFVTGWIARYLGPEQFGLWNYAAAFVMLFSMLANLGLDGIVIRNIIREPYKMNELLGSAFLLKLIGALIMMILTAIAIWLLRPGDILIFWLVVITAGSFVFQAFDTIDFYFQSQVSSKYTIYAKNTAFIIVSLIKVGLILLSAPLLSFVIAGLGEIVLASIFLVRVYSLQKHNIKEWYFKVDTAKRLIIDSWPLILSGIAIALYMRIDQVMIGQMLGNREVGIYSAAVKISEMWYFVPMVIASSLFPSIISLKANDTDTYYNRLQQLYDVMVLIGLSMAIFVTFTSNWIINILFGQEYIRSAGILALYIWSGIFTCLGVGSSNWLMAEDLQRYSFYRAALGAVINIILNFILIPRYGAMGAAVATLATQASATYLFDAVNRPTRQTFFMKTKSLFLFNIIKKVRYEYARGR